MDVLITGATAGIGKATADAFAPHVDRLVAVGRRAERLEEFAPAWREAGAEVECLALDVSDVDAVAAQADRFDVDVLINNAGLARGTDPMPTANVADWQEMIDTNVTGLLAMTRHALPHITKRAGHIVNLGSVAGRWVYPGGGVYCATKHAVRALSEGLRLDLQGTGVRVTNIEPGLVETEFSKVRFRGDTDKAKAVYQDTRPLRPEDVADTILWCVQRPAHVNVQELVLYPTDQASVRDVVRLSS